MKIELGQVSVDAGCLWIGDPCYILHTKEPPVDIRNSWEEFCDALDDKGLGVEHSAQFNFDGPNKTPGLGLVVESGYGDGTYTVYGEVDKRGRLMSVTIDFNHYHHERNEVEEEKTGFEDKDDDEFA